MVNLKCDETCKGGDNCTNCGSTLVGCPKACNRPDDTRTCSAA